MLLIKEYFLLIFIILSLAAFSQNDLPIGKEAFGDGEKLNYTVSYNWGFVWIDAGEVDFFAKKDSSATYPVWNFISTGSSLKRFDWLYKVRDTFEVQSTTDVFRPAVFKRNTTEGGHEVYNLYQFDHKLKKGYLYTKETGKGIKYDTVDLKNNVTDVLTATYLTRSLQFNGLQTNDTLKIPMLIDTKIIVLPIVFQGNEILETPSGVTFDCIKFSALLQNGTMFNAGENIYVWVTNDSNKIPVLIEAGIKVGIIKVHLTSFENVRHPLTSFIQKE